MARVGERRDFWRGGDGQVVVGRCVEDEEEKAKCEEGCLFCWRRMGMVWEICGGRSGRGREVMLGCGWIEGWCGVVEVGVSLVWDVGRGFWRRLRVEIMVGLKVRRVWRWEGRCEGVVGCGGSGGRLLGWGVGEGLYGGCGLLGVARVESRGWGDCVAWGGVGRGGTGGGVGEDELEWIFDICDVYRVEVADLETYVRQVWAECTSLPLWHADPSSSQSSKSSPDAGFKPSGDNEKKVTEELGKEGGDSSNDQEKEDNVNSTNNVNVASTNEVNVVGAKTSIELLDDPNMPELEDIVYSGDDEDVGVEADMSNLDAFMPRRKIDKTLFIRRDKGDILLVQVYVDDIIFGSTKKSLCTEFEKMMHKKFQMSSMGELTFFLGLQVKQKEDGIFISQDKYVTEILKKFGFTDVKTASTPIETQKPLLKDEDGEEVDVHLYRLMIGSLMYLTSSRPDIMFAVRACARYQVNPKVSHLYAVKRIFRYLKGQPKLGIWYPKDSPFDLVAYTDNDYAKASLDRMSTIRGTDFLPNATIFGELTRMSAKTTAWNEFSSIMASAIICLATNQKFNFSKYIFENMVKNLENVSDKFLMYPRFMQVFLNKKMEGMTSNKRIYVTPSHIKKIFANMRRAEKDFSGRVTPLFPTMVVQAQKEMGEGPAMPTDPHHTPIITQPSSSQPQKKHKSRRPKKKDTQVPQTSVPSDSTSVADEDSMTLKELMEFCTKLQQRLEKKKGSRTHKLKRLYKVGRSARIISFDEATLGDQEDVSKQGRKIDDIDADAGINLVSTNFDADTDMFGVHDLVCDEVFVKSEVAINKENTETVSTAKSKVSVADTLVSAATTTVADEVEITLAQTLKEIKSAKPKAKGIIMQEPSESTPTISLQQPSQIKFDEEEALRLQAEFDEEDRLAREKAQQKLFDKAVKRVNTFVAIDIESVEGSEVKAEAEIAQESSSKRAGEDLQQESTKKQKVDDDQETAKMKEHIEVVPDEEEVAIDVILLATKPPSIINIKFRGGLLGLKDFLMLLEVTAAHIKVTAAKLMLLVYKLILVVFRVNVDGTKLQLLKEFMLAEKRSKTYQIKYKD
ncbi:uncharacterized mitochondrial protein-like protein [Tanacetum coccineum]